MARVVRLELCQLPGVLFHQIGHLQQILRPLAAPHLRPGSLVEGCPGGLHRLFGVLRAGLEHGRVDLPRRRVDGLERLARRRVGERSSDEELERLGRLAHGVSVPPGIDASHRTEA